MESVITGLVSRFGYWGVLLLIAVENIFPPIPSEVILTFGGFLTTCTEMTPPGVILFSTLGSVAGAIVLYGVGRLLAPQRLEALLSGRAYAVTGDRIECDFTVNGQGLGETVRGAKRKLRCAVKGEYWADKLVIYKNCRPLAVLCGEQLRSKPARAYKLRVEMGWGNSEELMRWAGRITTDGRLAGANLYLRGRSLLSPTNHDGSPVEVNEIDNRVLEQDTQAFAWQCETVRNKSTLHPQTDAVVAEIEGGPDTVVNVTVNGRTHTASIAQLLDGGVTWHVKPWHSEAVKIHAAVPDSAYEMVLEAEDEGSGGMDVYHAEFAQKNGQWAFVSPIYAGL